MAFLFVVEAVLTALCFLPVRGLLLSADCLWMQVDLKDKIPQPSEDQSSVKGLLCGIARGSVDESSDLIESCFRFA